MRRKRACDNDLHSFAGSQIVDQTANGETEIHHSGFQISDQTCCDGEERYVNAHVE